MPQNYEGRLTLSLQPPEQLRCNFGRTSDPPREFQIIIEGFHLLGNFYRASCALRSAKCPQFVVYPIPKNCEVFEV